MDKSKQFYTETLGFKIVEDQGEYVKLQIGETGDVFLALNSQHRDFQVVGKQTILVHSDNIEEDYQKLTKAGVKVFDELSTQPWGKYFAFEDVDGNHIDVVQ